MIDFKECAACAKNDVGEPLCAACRARLRCAQLEADLAKARAEAENWKTIAKAELDNKKAILGCLEPFYDAEQDGGGIPDDAIVAGIVQRVQARIAELEARAEGAERACIGHEERLRAGGGAA